MTKAKGRARARGLVDMSEQVAEYQYVPPPAHECEPNHYVVPLADEQRLEVQSWVQRGLVVDFAIMQIVTDDQGVDIHIARIDCCHGTVHRHVFDARGEDTINGQVITVIPEKDSAKTVDSEYSLACDRMEAEWQENSRQWGRVRRRGSREPYNRS